MSSTVGTILFLPGDGIGPEVMEQVRRVIGWFSRQGLAFEVEEDLVGGAAYDRHGVPLADATMARALEVGTVMFGAVGGPAYDELPFAVKPERGLLRLRKEMDLFANLRPALVFPALAEASSLSGSWWTGSTS
jgi:3-isopropylmalate dehydrogenase